LYCVGGGSKGIRVVPRDEKRDCYVAGRSRTAEAAVCMTPS